MKYADLVKLSTPLPWEVARDPGGGYGSPWPTNLLVGAAGQVEIASRVDNENDAKIAAHCCNHFPKALEALKAMRPECDYESDEEMNQCIKLRQDVLAEMEEVK